MKLLLTAAFLAFSAVSLHAQAPGAPQPASRSCKVDSNCVDTATPPMPVTVVGQPMSPPPDSMQGKPLPQDSLLQPAPTQAVMDNPFKKKKEQPPQASTRAGPQHTITVTYQNASCNTTKGACNGQIYRSNSACPSGGGIVGPTWTLVIGTLAATTFTATGSSFAYTDAGVVNGLTYCYYATNQYTANNGADGPSGPSNTFQIQTPGPPDNPTNFQGTVN